MIVRIDKESFPILCCYLFECDSHIVNSTVILCVPRNGNPSGPDYLFLYRSQMVLRVYSKYSGLLD